LREYLTPPEVTQIMTATGKVGRHPMREATLRLLMDHHGFRVAHAIA
jgi:type 1 fimbriae regulatory protein FimB/type 1 fimbriae regulatory protein FimE